MWILVILCTNSVLVLVPDLKMTEVDVIDKLEERMKVLELKVYGDSEIEMIDEKTIVDSLIQSQTFTSSALSGRDKLSSLVKRLDHLEAVLDPTYEDSIIDAVAKTEFVLAMETELKEVTTDLMYMSELTPIFESEYIKNTPNLMSQMEKLILTMLENKEKHDFVMNKANELVTKYTEIMKGLTTVFALLEKTVTQLEIDALPKKVED